MSHSAEGSRAGEARGAGLVGPGGADSSGSAGASGAGLALVAAAGVAGVSAAACFDPEGGPGVPRLALLGWGLAVVAGALFAYRGVPGRGVVSWRGVVSGPRVTSDPRGGDLRPVAAAALLVLGTALLCAGGGGAAAAAVVALCVCGAGVGFVGVVTVIGAAASSVSPGAPRERARYAALSAVALAAGALTAAWWLPQAQGAAGTLACAAGLLHLARTASTQTSTR